MQSLFVFILLLFPPVDTWAKSMRTVRLSESDMETIYVEPGFSTLIKFDSHPQPGLIGDQDGFKVEYLKNMVAVKPLVAKGKTNLFLFTKDGQFNFQLLSGMGRHDNIVYAQNASAAREASIRPLAKPVLVDDLLTRKVGRASAQGTTKLTLVSVATPISRSTLVLKMEVATTGKDELNLSRENIFVVQGTKRIAIENIYSDYRKEKSRKTSLVLLLIRMDSVNPKLPLSLDLKMKETKSISIPFSADLGPLRVQKKEAFSL